MRPTSVVVAVVLLVTPAFLAAQADTLTAKVDAVFADVDKTRSPGCALGVLRDGRFIYMRGYGIANLDDGIPLSGASAFYIASTSKQFTAASVILLAQQGKLSLDDDIRKFLPELPSERPRVTVRHLIHHTSGIRDYLELMSLGGARIENVLSEDDVIALIARQQALNFTPGTEYSYSNSGYFLLAVIVKRVAGTSLREYADKHIFQPLGMRHTHFHDDRFRTVAHRVIGYDRRADTGFRLHYYANFEGVGDGGLWTTVEDLGLWDRNFYQPTVGGPEFVARLQTAGRLATGDTLIYAAGLVLGRHRGLRTVSHGGAFMGYRTELLRFPDQRFSVICLCNLSATNASTLARKVADVYLAGEFTRVALAADSATPSYIALPVETLRQRAGLYRNPVTGLTWELVLNDSGLAVKTSPASVRLVALTPTRFRAVSTPAPLEVTFEQPQPDKPVRLHVARGDLKPEAFERFERAVLTPAQLAEYAGEYYSDELRTSYHLTVKGDTLFVEIPNRSKLALTPTIRDAFVGGSASVTFVRDGRKRVSALLLRTSRVWNIRFERTKGSP